MRSAVEANIGREIAGRYRITERLGEGGMGTVYRAEQISLKRRVAVKVLKPELSADPALVRRFNAEAELAAKLNHPNTVTLYDFGQDEDGSLFIAMEFVEGESLRAVMLREGPIPVSRAVQICEQVCASISDAHAHGIIHRDLKPDNVMLTKRGKRDDVVRVLDFGIAKLRDTKSDVTAMPMTQAGDLLGTPQYMAPEQIRGEKVDARTDVYAMGAMLYELVTGRLPFEAPTLMAILSKHLTEMPVPPTDRRADLAVPHSLSNLVMNSLAKAPNDRPASMESFGDRLREIAETLSAPHARAPSEAGHFAPQIAVSSGLPSVVSPPPGVPRRLSTPLPPLTPPPDSGNRPQAPIEQSLAVARDSLARGGTPAHLAHAPAGSFQAHPPHGPPMTPPPMTPAPHQQYAPAMTPPPRSRDQPQSGGKGWLWAILAVVVIAGAGTAAFFALKSSNKGADKDKDDTGEDKDDSGDDDGSDSDVPSLHDWDLNSTSGSDDEPGPDAEKLDGDSWTHPAYPIVITHPSGFSHNQTGALHVLTGRARGIETALYVVAAELPSPPSVAVQKSQLAELARESGAVVIRDGEQMIAGARRYTAVYEVRGVERGQTVAYVKDRVLVFVGFATAPGAFAKSKRLRSRFFERGVAIL